MSDPSPPTPVPEGARCAVHPERPAEHTCQRCGSYACSECRSAAEPGLCAACANRMGPHLGFPFTRDRHSLDGLLKVAVARWRENWLVLLLYFGGSLVVVYGVSLGGEWALDRLADQAGEGSRLHSPLHPVRLLFQVAASVLQVAANMLIFGLCIHLLQGHGSSPLPVASWARQLPNALLQVLLIYLAIAIDLGLHYLLFEALGGTEGGWMPLAATVATYALTLPVRVYLMLGVAFATPVLLVDPNADAIGALRRSFRIAAGHRLEMIGIGIVAGIIAAAGVLACCVGALVSLPIATLLYCGLFLALTNEPAVRSSS